MSRPALLIIDMLNDFDFRDPDALIAGTEAIVPPVNALRAQARAAGFPVIFVNDNYGRWTDERSELYAWLTRAGARGGDIARRVAPAADEYFVIKPEASGFYATPLPALLPRLGVTSLALVGIAAEMCVQFTAADAHMREYPLWVPADAVAGATPERAAAALTIIGEALKADIRPTSEVSLTAAFA